MIRARIRLVVLARWPAPGRCKQRLAVVLGDQRAAAVQAHLTAHVLGTARRACAGRAELLLATSGLGPRAAARWGRSLGADRITLQGEGSLGLRLQRQVVQARREGIRRLVLIGSDLPELAAADLEAAFSALEAGNPLVLGPARDGGYWLLGLGWPGSRRRGESAGRPVAPSTPRLFAGSGGAIAWGSARVAEQTLAAAAREGLSATLLAQRSDLDRPADLRRWR